MDNSTNSRMEYCAMSCNFTCMSLNFELCVLKVFGMGFEVEWGERKVERGRRRAGAKIGGGRGEREEMVDYMRRSPVALW